MNKNAYIRNNIQLCYGDKARFILKQTHNEYAQRNDKDCNRNPSLWKVVFAFNLFSDYLKSQGVDEGHIIKVDLEDRRNKKLRNPDALLEYIDAHITKDGMHYVMLDEVQWVEEFEDVLNSYLKIPNVDVYVTGSNSKFLSSDVITEFRGRGDEIKVAPLSFSEYFSVFNGSKQEAMEEYLTFGGLPKIATMRGNEEKMKYLQTLFKKTYITDILERYKIKNEEELEELINILASSIGGLINPNKLVKTFKSVKNVSISPNTLSFYLEILQEVFMVEKSIRYDIKGKKYIDTPAKYYFADLGLRNARINFRQYEVTHLMENLIYNELRVRELFVDVGVVVVNTKDEEGKSQRKQLEVDFVCNQGSKRCYIQSALRLPNEEKREQELRSLMNISDNFQKFIITEDPIKRYQDENGVVFMNIYEFLLDKESLKV